MNEVAKVSHEQKQRFSQALDKLYQCCSERHASLSERFKLPQAELRCLLLFGGEPYLTAKGVAARLNVAKSRVTKIVAGLVAKSLLRKLPDPEDSRVALLALTPAGARLRAEISQAMDLLRDAVLERIEPKRRETVLQALEVLKTGMEKVRDEIEF